MYFAEDFLLFMARHGCRARLPITVVGGLVPKQALGGYVGFKSARKWALKCFRMNATAFAELESLAH